MCEAGQVEAALAILLMFESYGRPSDIMSLVKESIVPPVCGLGVGQFVVVLIRSEELGGASKIGVYDLSTPLDLGRRAWLACLILRLAARRRPSHRLWSVEQASVGRAFFLAARRTGVARLAPCLYSLRHGGASHDRLVNARRCRRCS